MPACPGGGGGGGGGGGHVGIYGGTLTLVIKVLKNTPKALISGQKSILILKKNADFFQYKNTPSFIKTMTLDEREHIFLT